MPTARKSAILLFAALIAAAPSAMAQVAKPAERFVAGVEDLPLMAALRPLGTADTRFDSPAGRIVIAYAEGNATRAAVVEFYAATLNQLGWQRVADAVWRREGEQLRLEFGERDGAVTVRFTLAPVL